jgi:hypothetical protein
MVVLAATRDHVTFDLGSFVDQALKRHTSAMSESTYGFDLVNSLRRRAESWFGTDSPSGDEVAARIVEVALELGAVRAETSRFGAWHVVSADIDWLDGVEGEGDEVFQRIVPIPGRVNSIRPEIWLTAYAESVAIYLSERTWLVQGSEEGCEILERLAQPFWTRSICFRFG